MSKLIYDLIKRCHHLPLELNYDSIIGKSVREYILKHGAVATKNNSQETAFLSVIVFYLGVKIHYYFNGIMTTFSDRSRKRGGG